MSKITAKDEKSTIKQGTIAEFMRKRTQLVGFEFGYWKHTGFTRSTVPVQSIYS
ncbi:MAG: hypothetical protein ACFFAO_12200 [Candidatus Hermodarchaeota archaeon]